MVHLARRVCASSQLLPNVHKVARSGALAYGRRAGRNRLVRRAIDTAGNVHPGTWYDLCDFGIDTDCNPETPDLGANVNGQGYILEVDPYDKTKPAKKRSALGRFAHESAAFGVVTAGQPLAVYMGDDSRNEYIYKFVSATVWSAADATPADRIATGAQPRRRYPAGRSRPASRRRTTSRRPTSAASAP